MIRSRLNLGQRYIAGVKFTKILAERNIISLIGKTRSRGNRTKRFDDPTEDLVKRAIDYYLTLERPSINSAYKRLRFYEWENSTKTGVTTSLPSYDAFRKRIHLIDRHLLTSKRFSKRVADMQFKAYKKGLVAARPLELTEIDHTPADLMVVNLDSRLPLGRPTLTSLIDKFSRMPVGFYFSFTPPSVNGSRTIDTLDKAIAISKNAYHVMDGLYTARM